jgi:hypothetical protein
MGVLSEMSPQQVISRGSDVPWPAHSPDLTTYDNFLWGFLKHKVFITNPRAIEELKQRIKEETAAILDHDSLGDGNFSQKTAAMFKKWWRISE